jgi:hypothetical protein
MNQAIEFFIGVAITVLPGFSIRQFFKKAVAETTCPMAQRKKIGEKSSSALPAVYGSGYSNAL